MRQIEKFLARKSQEFGACFCRYLARQIASYAPFNPVFEGYFSIDRLKAAQKASSRKHTYPKVRIFV